MCHSAHYAVMFMSSYIKDDIINYGCETGIWKEKGSSSFWLCVMNGESNRNKRNWGCVNKLNVILCLGGNKRRARKTFNSKQFVCQHEWDLFSSSLLLFLMLLVNVVDRNVSRFGKSEECHRAHIYNILRNEQWVVCVWHWCYFCCCLP